MKISIGSKIVEGPWGGGNLFVKNLSNYLIKKGHKVIYDLSESDIDLILLTDPRSRKESSSTFNHNDILKYKKYVNANSVVVQRINECDERKGTDFINQFYLNASNCADHVVFVSSWLKDIYLKLGMSKDKTSVILAGANSEIFNSKNSSNWNKKEKIKLVTHHWSNHKNKGFDSYQQIDGLISHEKWKNKIEFTYIGNFNQEYDFKFSFSNTRRLGMKPFGPGNFQYVLQPSGNIILITPFIDPYTDKLWYSTVAWEKPGLSKLKLIKSADRIQIILKKSLVFIVI